MKRIYELAPVVALTLALCLSSAFYALGDVNEERGTIQIDVEGDSYEKRYVLRYPDDRGNWNGRLLIGAHGGGGGDNYSRDGRVIGTDEVSLDDVVGDHAVAHGFAYASVDRDGIGGTVEGLKLTQAFTALMKARVSEQLGRDAEKTYLAGLSMGGVIARFAAEDASSPYDGVLIIVGGGGDSGAQRERSKKMAELWPRLDELGPEAYAQVVGTPAAAARFWPYMGRSASARAQRPSSGEPIERDDTTGAVAVPTIEVAGTYDDFTYPEIVAYKDKVRARGAAQRHRLYSVEGAWHISRDDDAISSFQYIGSRMGLSERNLDDMATGASYLPAVRDSLLLLDAWVSRGESPPPDRTLSETSSLLPDPA